MASFPLDWMLSNDFQGLIKAFEENFVYFLDPQFLIFNEERRSVINVRYGFETDHFWDDQPQIKAKVTGHNFLKYCAQLRPKFEKRIRRLYEILSGDVPVYLIRKKVIDPLHLICFRELLLRKFPQIRLSFIIFDEVENPYSEIPNVKYYKVNNVDDFPGRNKENFKTRSGWSELLEDLEKVWNS